MAIHTKKVAKGIYKAVEDDARTLPVPMRPMMPMLARMPITTMPVDRDMFTKRRRMMPKESPATRQAKRILGRRMARIQPY